MRQTTTQEVQQWLSNLSDLQRTKSCRAPEFLRPFHFVTLALVLKANRADHIELPDTIKQYATRMHLWEAVGLQPPIKVAENSSRGRFIPIETLQSRDHTDACARRVTEITAHTSMCKEAKESLSIALSELMDNCFAHARVEGGLHGLACAQYWPKGNLLQVAIADMGIGIRESFKVADSDEMKRRAENSNCCSLATELHASSKLHNGHAGYGLALTRQLAENNGGVLGLYSGNEWHHHANGDSQCGSECAGWGGTLVLVEFDTTKGISTQQVYQNWPPVRGYDDDDFDF
ncbi:ATP-binding protein [Comamonas jiangduensis]|uniref:ATP-binding protein n=1 Tax=Comamonas jiangduensis TaxID=1194168 RepID=UPI003BF88656